MLIVQEFNRDDKLEQQTEMIKWEITVHKIERF
jgi:hypothetical protein